jgi:hypothetical protein
VFIQHFLGQNRGKHVVFFQFAQQHDVDISTYLYLNVKSLYFGLIDTGITCYILMLESTCTYINIKIIACLGR